MRRNILEIIIYFSSLHLALSVSLFASSNDCKKKTGNFPKEGSLCRSYYKCTNWIPKEIRCPRDEHFFPEKGYCVRPEMYPCFENTKSKECPRPHGKFLRPGTGCKIFYDCNNGVAVEKRCSDDLLFDPDQQKCEWPEIYTCKETTKSKECPRLNGKFLRPGTRCKIFYDCKNGVATEKRCPGDQLFDPVQEKCEWPEIYTCDEGIKTTESTVLQPTSAPKIITPLDTTITNRNIITNSVFPKSSITPSSDSDENSSEEGNNSEEKISSTKIKMKSTTPRVSTSSSESSEEGNSSEEEFKQSSPISKSTFTTSKISTTSTSSPDEKIITDSLGSSSSVSSAEDHKISSTNSSDEKLITDDLSSSSSISTSEDHKISSTNSPNENIITDTLSSSLSVSTTEDPKISSTNSPDENLITDTSSSYSSVFTEEDHGASSTNSPDEKIITEISFSSSRILTERDHETQSSSTQESSELPITTIDLTAISSTTESRTKETTVNIVSEGSSTVANKIDHSFTETFTFPEITSKVTTPVTATYDDEDIGSTTKESYITNSVTVHIFCPHSDGYFPHPNDKHKFIACVGGDPIIMSCPANLVYDHGKRSCEYEYT